MKVICLTCDQEMPDGIEVTEGTSWHLEGCPDGGVVADNWEKRGEDWYLKGTEKVYTKMEMR